MFPTAKDSYEIEQSLLIDDGNAFQVTFPVDGRNYKQTFSFWMKGATAGHRKILTVGAASDNPGGAVAGSYIGIYPSGLLNIGTDNRIDTSWECQSDGVYLDPAAWTHVVWSVDSSGASPEPDRVKLFINGARVPANMDGMLVQGDKGWLFIDSKNHQIGQSNEPAWDYHYDGYLAEFHAISGEALGPEHFGLEGGNGEWNPIAYGGDYGINGFYLPFEGRAANWFIDSSSYHHKIIGSGVEHTLSEKKVGNSSIDIPTGTSNNLTLPAITFGSNDFTVEFWVKGQPGMPRVDYMFNNYLKGTGHGIYITNDSAGTLTVYTLCGGVDKWAIAAGSFDPSVWSHVAVVRSGSTLMVYLNGSSVATSTVTGDMLSSGPPVMGGSPITSDGYGYFDEVRVSSTARYTGNFTPDTTEFVSDSDTEVLIHSNWSPDESIGSDHSGNDQDWEVMGFASDSVVADTPTNNYATWNPLVTTAGVNYERGNLRIADYTSQVNAGQTIPIPSSGKWAFEFTFSRRSGGDYDFGWMLVDNPIHTSVLIESQGTGLVCGGANHGAPLPLPVPGATNAIYLDMDNLKFSQFLDGVPVWTDISFYAGGHFIKPSSRSSGSNFGITINFGQRPFTYEPPEGFQALCTNNLPDVTVNPKENFKAVTYSGNGGSQTITTGFETDLVWVKRRDAANYHILTDSVRGAEYYLVSNNTDPQPSPGGGAQMINGLLSTGFTVGTENPVNNPDGSYVSWSWKAGGDAVPDNSGDFPAYVSANKDMGFSVVKYTGTYQVGQDKTIPHGLGVPPAFLVTKKINDFSNWEVYAKPMGARKAMFLNELGAMQDYADGAMWPQEPDANFFHVGWNGGQGGAGEYIAYCFANTDMLQVGSFTGNGLDDGPFVSLPFRPAFFMLKGMAGSGSWIMMDTARNTYNPASKYLEAETNSAEYDITRGDMLSNGFKLRGSGTALNGAGRTYLYLAIAEQPFKHARGR